MSVTDPQQISLVPNVVNFALYQGDTLTFTVTVKNSNGSAYPLTGSNSTMKIKRLSGTEVISLTVGSGITYTNAAGGIMSVTITATQSAALPTEKALAYDLQLEQSSGTIINTLVRGTITVTPQITS
ncbi:MAG: hypothetical protein EBR82_27975 [Caulobacteraceae bacterium]|nr:hypothetical protein [Caulobacteraceae bacterium]